MNYHHFPCEVCFINVDKTQYSWKNIDRATDLEALCVILREKQLKEEHKNAKVKGTIVKEILLALTQNETLNKANEVDPDQYYHNLVIYHIPKITNSLKINLIDQTRKFEN